MAKLKEKAQAIVEEVKETVAVAEAHYEKAEVKADSLLQQIVDSKFTALILGGVLGFIAAFFLVTC